MAAGPIIRSVLKEAVTELPEDYARKSGDTVVNELLKKGVKQEELNFSGVEIPKENVTKADLLKAVGERKDWFKTTEKAQGRYKFVNIDTDNPTYREKVTTFGRKGELDSSYTSGHFPDDKNYLMHTRIQDDTMDGKKSRVLLEIQSDLHQEARSTGYIGDKPGFEKLQAMKQDFDAGKIDTETFMEEMRNKGYTGPAEHPSIDEFFMDNYIPENAIPKSPYEKTWLAKGIERELVDAVNEGREQLVVPITGERIQDLHRSEGVQKWYETTVVNTMKKIAKQTGSDFVMDAPKTPAPIKVNFTQAELDKVRADYEALAAKYRAGEIDRRDFSDFVGNFLSPKMAEIEELNPGVDINYFDMLYDITDSNKTVKQFTAIGGTDDISYARIIPRSKDFKVTMYSSPVAAAFVAYQAYQAGQTEEEVNAKLKERGYDDEDIGEINTRVGIISQAVEADMPIEEIRAKMEGREVTTGDVQSTPKSLKGQPTGNAELDKLIDEEEPMSAEELISSLKRLNPTMVSDVMTSIPAWFGNQEAKQKYDMAREASRNRIISIAKNSYGLDLVWEGGDVGDEAWYAQTEEGLVEVTPGFWQDFKTYTGEMVGGTAGAIYFGKKGMQVGGATALAIGQMGPQALLPEELVTVPLGMAIGGVLGIAFGGTLGTAGGSQVDHLYHAMKMQEKLEAEAMAYNALNATEMALVGEVIGYPVAKTLGVGWKGVVAAKDHILHGEAKAGYRALKDITFLSDDQIDVIVTQTEKYAKLDGSNRYEKAIQAVALTEPGMQDLVKAAGSTRSKASAASAHGVKARADEILTATANLTDENVTRTLVQDLGNYTSDVKKFYGDVKAQATQSPRAQDFAWDFEELAIKPVMEDLLGKITDPATKEKYVLQMSRIAKMTDSRSFGDLLELRQLTNDFLYNKNIVKADDKATLRGVIDKIDEAIEQGASVVMENPEKWLDDWATARADYSQMKRVERTAMFQAMFNKDGTLRAVSPEEVTNALGRYITALDGSFEEILTKLPLEGRKNYEGAVLDALTNKYTAGITQGAKAIHFPMLADELRKISFTTPDARATKKAIMDLSEVFKNDVYLAQTTGQIVIPKFQSYLTADPVVRAKFEIASGLFNIIKSKAPGDANRQIALVRAAAKLLEKPLDVKAFKQIQGEVFDDANLSRQVLELQQAAARDRMKQIDNSIPRVKIYAGGKLKGTTQVASIPQHRILTLQQAKDIAEAEALTLDSKSLDAVLVQYGYKAILQGSDRVRILGE